MLGAYRFICVHWTFIHCNNWMTCLLCIIQDDADWSTLGVKDVRCLTYFLCSYFVVSSHQVLKCCIMLPQIRTEFEMRSVGPKVDDDRHG